MSRHSRASALLAGCSAAGLFLLAYYFVGISELLLLPALPLFFIGLAAPFTLLLTALTASLAVLAIANFYAAIFFLAFIGLPVLLLSPLLTARKHTELGEIWLPVGRAVTDLCIYVALIFAAIMAYHLENGGLQHFIQEQVKSNLALVEEAGRAQMEALTTQWGFLLLAFGAWWWAMVVYAYAAFANHLLFRQKLAIRPRLALMPFLPSGSFLILLAAAGAGTLLADSDLAFAARVIFCIFLLPYFLVGISIAHFRVKSWPNRGLALFTLYLATLLLVFPILLLAVYGIWRHCAALFHAPRQAV